MRNAGFAALFTLIVIAFAACGGGRSQGSTSTPGEESPRASRLVSPRDFASATAHPGTVLVNVHVPYAGEIAGTDLFLPYDKVEARAAALPSRSATLAIYCRTGRMSAIAARTLSKLGYRRIVELRGGMRAWTSSGLVLRQRGQ